MRWQRDSRDRCDAAGGRRAAHVADLGCGEGFFLTKLHAYLAHTAPVACIGVDISRAGVKMAASNERQITWVVASLHHSPFLPASLDVALSMFSPIATTDLKRVLKSGDRVTVTRRRSYRPLPAALLLSRHMRRPAPMPRDAVRGGEIRAVQ